MPRRRAVICDLDGTLTSCEWRRKYLALDPPDWDAFFAGIPFDPVVPAITRWIAARRCNGHLILLVSGRPSSWRIRRDTYGWLAKHDIGFDALYMRAEGDRRRDEVVKEDIYRTLIEPRFEVLEVCDDGADVCDMWQRIGLPLRRVVDPADREPFTRDD